MVYSPQIFFPTKPFRCIAFSLSSTINLLPLSCGCRVGVIVNSISFFSRSKRSNRPSVLEIFLNFRVQTKSPRCIIPVIPFRCNVLGRHDLFRGKKKNLRSSPPWILLFLINILNKLVWLLTGFRLRFQEQYYLHVCRKKKMECFSFQIFFCWVFIAGFFRFCQHFSLVLKQRESSHYLCDCEIFTDATW